MPSEEIRTLISVAALLVSLISLLLVRMNWRESNRPIVTAFVEDDSSGGTAIFHLIIANTGNRPAVRVRLHANEAQIAALMHPEADKKRLEILACNFSAQSEVPLLRNGEELSTSFGAFSTDQQNGKWLQYGTETEISVTYADLDGRRYKSKLPLKIYAREGFGGGTWVTQKPVSSRLTHSNTNSG